MLVKGQGVRVPKKPTHAGLLAAAKQLAVRAEDDLYPGGDDAAYLILTLVDAIEWQDEIIVETVAACVTCDTAISQLILKYEPIIEGGFVPLPWINARAACHLARHAVKPMHIVCATRRIDE